MSRAKAVEAFGRAGGDRLYKRFYTMKSKAAHAGVPFSWKSFDEFWPDFVEKAPADFDPKTHRFKFDLSKGLGYCSESMTVQTLYFSSTGKVNQSVAGKILQRLMTDPEEVPESLGDKALDHLLTKLKNTKPSERPLAKFQEPKPLEILNTPWYDEMAVSWGAETAIKIAERLDEGEMDFNTIINP